MSLKKTNPLEFYDQKVTLSMMSQSKRLTGLCLIKIRGLKNHNFPKLIVLFRDSHRNLIDPKSNAHLPLTISTDIEFTLIN